ncbi:MAG: PIG-L family deacetylase [Anaerolineales bacterium]|nr:PIG-L family deacetylase [Anaerolineales bacterium]
MGWIYLSPHFDDIALSCGGLVWEQAQGGAHVAVWTVCAGEQPPGPYSAFAEMLHNRWETGPIATEQRREEDILSCKRMGADYLHLSIADCIYRRSETNGEHLYTSDESIMGALHIDEMPLAVRLAGELMERLPEEATLVCPLALGGHVDHRLTRTAAERTGRPLLYYADYPYVLKQGVMLEQMRSEGWQEVDYPVAEEGLASWQEVVAAHASQISTFWADLAEMQAAIAAYWGEIQGVRLWKPPAGLH